MIVLLKLFAVGLEKKYCIDASIVLILKYRSLVLLITFVKKLAVIQDPTLDNRQLVYDCGHVLTKEGNIRVLDVIRTD